MVPTLDRSTIDAFVSRRGIALINWYSRHHPLSRLFDADYVDASIRHPEVMFAYVDVGDDPALAAWWGVPRAPELMGFRDGTLVFHHAGVLPQGVIDALIGAIGSLDMEQVRKGVDGGSRLYLSMRPKGAAHFDLGGSADDEPTTASAVPSTKH